MEELDKHLNYFIRQKISTDSMWQKIVVIYSGYKVSECLNLTFFQMPELKINNIF